jgi:DNA helicase-2/ATP-dependent DNA helicase PcrA
VENYRSTPQILELANRLVAGVPGSGARVRGALRTTRPDGPKPSIRRFADGDAELRAIVAGIREALASGIEAAEIAVLVRINAQLPEIEQALTRAGIPFQVRGQRFFARREVGDARRLLRGSGLGETGATLVAAIRRLFTERLGLGAEAEAAGDEARERSASLELLVDIAQDLASTNAGLTVAGVLAELDRRDAEEASGSTAGVNLLTYHRAKGLEWDAVFLPALEEGLLPIRQAKEDDEVAEEQRLLYVGITRARQLLALSWAARREGAGGKETQRRPSRFLAALEDPAVRAARRVTLLAGAPMAAPRRAKDDDSPLMAALRAWRLTTARSEGVSAFIVAPDSLLLEIAAQCPTTIAALRRVKGMGPSRLSRYGEEILEIVGGT